MLNTQTKIFYEYKEAKKGNYIYIYTSRLKGMKIFSKGKN